MKKLRNGLLLLLIIFMAIGIVPLVKAAGHDASVNGSKGGKLGSNNTNTKWPSPYYYAVRMTAINNDGTIVKGTHSAVFANKSQVGALKGRLYRNENTNSTKWHTIRNGVKWVLKGNSRTYEYPDGYYVKRENSKWKAKDSMPAKHFRKVASNPKEFKKYLKLLGYDYEKMPASELAKQYVVVEPMTVVMVKGKKYFGTSTEISKGIDSYIESVARTPVGITMCYTGSFNKAAKEGTTVGGVKLQYKITNDTKLKAYKAGKLSGKGGCEKPTKDEILKKYSKTLVNGNAIGIFHMAGNGDDPTPGDEPPQCNYDDPLNFHTESNDLELANPNCCAEALSQLTAELGSAAKAKEKLYADYPVCRYSPTGDCYKNPEACDAEPQYNNPVCKNNEKGSKVVKDSTNWNNIFANKTYQSYYKIADASTKYCYVYCSEDIDSSFPASYTGKASPGNVFIWPKDYDTIFKNKATCKVRVRSKEWEYDYENGRTSLNDINKCNDDSILTSSVKGVYKFTPTVKLSYQTGNGNKVDGETLKSGYVKKSETDTGVNDIEKSKNRAISRKVANPYDEIKDDTEVDVELNAGGAGSALTDVSAPTGSHGRIYIDNYKKAVESRTSTFSSTIGYLLPSDFYQYVSKINKGWIRKLGGKFDSGKYIDTKSSHLYVSDKAIINKKYDLILNYGGLSAFKNKAKVNYFAGDYKCKYTPTQPNSTCDPNEKTHFVRNGVTITDGGPHGENCCSDIAKRYGTNSTVYKKLVEQGWCGAPKTDCDYNNPNDFANKLNDPTDKSAENGNCCNMVKNDPSPDAQAAYKKYCPSDICCPGDYNDDGTCANGDMTKQLRACVNSGKSYDECEKNNCPYGRRVIYRPIDLKDPFPGVKDTNRIQTKKWQLISNWSSKTTVSSSPSEKVKRYITNNRGVKEDSVYNLSPMYIIKLNPRTVASVKTYNLTTSYDDFNMKCDSNGRKCRSEYIQKLKSQNIISGCGADKNWYSCQGVEESRGD